MPVRITNRQLGLPKMLNANRFSGGSNGALSAGEEDTAMSPYEMSKYLPFIDTSTGLKNRYVERDPITGLGNLGAENDELRGCHLKSLSRENLSGNNGGESGGTGHAGNMLPRNPILLQGNLGQEYNCLNTTRHLETKPRENRNIVTLDGELGEELDPIRPHGGRPKSVIRTHLYDRNPITGEGNFGNREWDPIGKYNGRRNIRRPANVKRDPITFSVSMENMGELNRSRGLKHFDMQSEMDQPYDNERANRSAKGRTERKETMNVVTNEDRPGVPSVEPLERPKKKAFTSLNIGTNPITHENEEFVKYLDEHLPLSPRSYRDPIVGEGVEDLDLSQSFRHPPTYFRDLNKKPTPAAAEKSKPKPKPAKKAAVTPANAN